MARETQKAKIERLEKELENANNTIQQLKNENEELKKSINVHKIKNERGAGRKARFTDTEIETIKMYRIQGKTIKEIADMFKCSVGLVHKIINI